MDWITSFKELKLNNKEPTAFKPPKELEYLFGNEINKNDEEDNSMAINEKYRHVLADGINMDLGYMRTLTSN